jgi:hypothetical protein
MRMTAWLAMLAVMATVVTGASRVQAAVKDGLITHLQFEDNLNDSTSKGYNATAPSAPSGLFFTTGKFGEALDLSFGDAVEFATLANSYSDLQFGSATDFTVSFWVQKMTSAENDSRFASFIGNKNFYSTQNPGWIIAQDGENWQWAMSDAAGNHAGFTGGGNIFDGDWYHLAVTHDRSGMASFYQDGVQIGAADISDIGDINTASILSPVDGAPQTIGIGQDGTRGLNYRSDVQTLQNNLDDLAIWNRALTSGEVLSLAVLGRQGTSLSAITPAMELVAGDVNGDDLTNVEDYDIWRANVGFTNGTSIGDAASLAKGDANMNGRVELGDFQLISQFASPSLAVPEPSSVALAGCGLLGVLFARRRRLAAIAAGLAAVAFGGSAKADSFFIEDFEGAVLEPSVNEPRASDRAWTDELEGWTIDDSGVPGALSGDDARDGVTEWAGWSFVDKLWWQQADQQRRIEFTKGKGNVAVADNDEYDDAAHDPFYDEATGAVDTYDAYMTSPVFSVEGFRAGKVTLRFDSSFRPEANDDTPAYNDQSSVIWASYNGGPMTEVMRWTSDPAAPMGGIPKDDNSTNDSIAIPLDIPAGTTEMQIKIGQERAENDWWWAIDNVSVADALPEFKLVVDAVDGDVGIVNDSKYPVDLKGYEITSASGSLNLAAFAGLQDSGDAGAGWLESTNLSGSTLSETNLGDSFILAPGASLYLGAAFKLTGTQDIAFSSIGEFGGLIVSPVEYDEFEPDSTPIGQDGDTNGDGTVDLEDLNAVRNNFGATGTVGSTPGDAYPFDGVVDLEDLNGVRNNFGAGPSNSVPEPSSFALLALSAFGGLGWMVSRRR